ncbi:MAG: methyltransferase domain-containing protein [Candidatus Omnitrophota bacterium]
MAKKIAQLLHLLLTRIRIIFKIKPLSFQWGHDRGKPLYRYYTEIFLEKFSKDIKGKCLEFQEDCYASRFGKNKIEDINILHKEPGNPKATIVADLTKANTLKSDTFDCIISTFVLHVVVNPDKFVSELYRILKPKGSVLIVAPHICMWGEFPKEYWRFTQEGLKLLIAKHFKKENIIIKSYGNSLIAAGALRGLVTKEFRKSELNYHDKKFSLITCARAVK